jgi:hypothetical protein
LDVDEIELTTIAAMGGINADPAFVPAGSRMIVHTPLAFVFRRLGELPQVDPAIRSDVIKVRYLQAADIML